MGALRQIALALVGPKERRIAENKRELERRLRDGGLSRQEAKKAVAAHFRAGP